MKEILKKTGYSDMLISVIFALIGLFMIVNAETATKIISNVIGGVIIAVGIVKIISYYIAKKNDEINMYNIFYGIIAVIVGLIIITCSGLIGSIFRIMIGIWIIYSGIIRLSFTLRLRNADCDIWKVSIILSIIIVIGGLYILFNQGAIILTIGTIILVYSISDLMESVIFMKYIDKL